MNLIFSLGCRISGGLKEKMKINSEKEVFGTLPEDIFFTHEFNLFINELDSKSIYVAGNAAERNCYESKKDFKISFFVLSCNVCLFGDSL